MNGECKAYRLNSPMSWDEFKAMPDDIKITYVKLLREKFSCPDSKIGEMMGVGKDKIHLMFKKLGLTQGKPKGRKFDKEGFCAWLNGVEKVPAPVIEEPTLEEAEEPEVFAEDDIPFEEPDPIKAERVLTGIRPSHAELEAELMKAKEENAWLRNECNRNDMKIRILEAQMEVVRMIFGGNNHG